MARSQGASATKPAARVPPTTRAARDSGPCAGLEAEADRRCRVAHTARFELGALTERLAVARAEQADRPLELAQRAAEAADQACVEARRAAAACAESIREAEIERLAAEAQAAAEARAEAQAGAEARAAAQLARAEAAAGQRTAAATRRGVAVASAPVPDDVAAASAAANRMAASEAAARQAAVHQAAAERALGVGVAGSAGPVNERARSMAASTPLDTWSDDTGAARIGAGGRRGVAPATAIHRILSGDLAALSATADAMADDPETRCRWEARLTDLLETILLRAVDAGAIRLPSDHPFWGVFSDEQSRDIMSALSALGCRFDGLGGWLDDRVPTQRDLSIAVAHAGLDPMRIRHWPTLAEAEELVRDAEVLGTQYLSAAAPGLTVREMTTVLGPDALRMADVLRDWEQIRGLLLLVSDGAGARS